MTIIHKPLPLSFYSLSELGFQPSRKVIDDNLGQQVNLGIENVLHTLSNLITFIKEITSPTSSPTLIIYFRIFLSVIKASSHSAITQRHKHINTDNIHTIKECDIRWSFLSCYFQLWFLFTTAHNTRLNFLWFFGRIWTDWLNEMNE